MENTLDFAGTLPLQALKELHRALPTKKFWSKADLDVVEANTWTFSQSDCTRTTVDELQEVYTTKELLDIAYLVIAYIDLINGHATDCDISELAALSKRALHATAKHIHTRIG